MREPDRSNTPTTSTPTTSTSTAPIGAEQARALLREAGMRRRATPGFSPFVAGFAGMCGVSALGSMAMRLAWERPAELAVVIVATFVFALAAVFSPFFGGLPTAARGFSKRWASLMSGWGALWTLTLLVPTSLIDDAQAAFWWAAAFALGFLVLLLVAVLSEGARVRRACSEGVDDGDA